MDFAASPISGAYLVEHAPHADHRGSFTRTFCRREFEAAGLNGTVAQTNLSTTVRRGTVRGLHWSAPPHAETKVVQCLRGTIFDVIVDLREDSPSFLNWFAVALAGDTPRALYVPVGVAHGYQTLTDDVLVSYAMGTSYVPGAGRGLRYDDPTLAIGWPLEVSVVSEQDRGWPTVSEWLVTRREAQPEPSYQV